MHVTNLEPDIFLSQRSWWIRNNVPETLGCISNVSYQLITSVKTYLKTLLVLLLLLVNYTKPEVNLIRLFEIWLHAHNLRERFFGMFE